MTTRRKVNEVVNGNLQLVQLAEQDLVDGNEHKLDHEADAAHDGESDSAGRGDLNEFWVRQIVPFLSGLLHFWMKPTLSS